MKKSIIAVSALLIIALGLTSGCSTVDGVGKDVESLGEGIQDAAD